MTPVSKWQHSLLTAHQSFEHDPPFAFAAQAINARHVEGKEVEQEKLEKGALEMGQDRCISVVVAPFFGVHHYCLTPYVILC